jgi:hypothetical protein
LVERPAGCSQDFQVIRLTSYQPLTACIGNHGSIIGAKLMARIEYFGTLFRQRDL